MLHEPPLQKCGTGHWLTDPCPAGKCDLLVFEKDMVVLRPVVSAPKDLEVEVVSEETAEGPVKRSMTPAEKQRLWRERNAEKVRERDRLRKAGKKWSS